jgi:hypothetical protein
MHLGADCPVSPSPDSSISGGSHGPSWWLGKGTAKRAYDYTPYAYRKIYQGAAGDALTSTQDHSTVQRHRVPHAPPLHGP